MRYMITQPVEMSDDKVEELIKDLDRLNNPSNLITYNDGYYAQSLERKWHLNVSALDAIAELYKRRKLRDNKRAQEQKRRASMQEMG